MVIPEATTKGYALANDGDYVNLSYMESNTRRGRVGKGVSQTLLCNDNNGVVVKDSKEVYICAQRGRNPDDPNSRKVVLPTEQMIEVNKSGCSNTLTTVQKDNLVYETSGIYLNASTEFDRGPLKGLSRTLKSENHDAGVVENNLRIRKLTPRECGRLMGVSDDDITKMERVNSNSQLYKQFGNSIVVDVLYYLFKQMCEEVK